MTEAIPATRPVDRIPLWWLVVPLVVLTGATFVADVVWPLLVHTHPLLLMVISSRNRHLILVAPLVSLWPYLTVAVTRGVLGDLPAFALGRRYGDRAIEHLVDRAGRRAPQARKAVRVTRRAAPLAVLFMSGNLMCAVVGATRMSWRRFLILDTVGTAFGVLMTRFIGDWLAAPIGVGLGWVVDHRWPVTAAMLTFVVAVQGVRWLRRGHRVGLAEVIEELEALDEAPAPEGV